MTPTPPAPDSLSPAELLYYALVLAKDAGDEPGAKRLAALDPAHLAAVLDADDASETPPPPG